MRTRSPPGKQRKNFRRQGSASAVGIAEILQITEEALAKLHRGHPRVIQCFALSATLRRAKTVEKFRDSFAKFDTAPRGRERRSTRDAVTVEDAKQIEHKVLHKSTLRFAYLMFDALHPLSYEKEGEIDMGPPTVNLRQARFAIATGLALRPADLRHRR